MSTNDQGKSQWYLEFEGTISDQWTMDYGNVKDTTAN